MQVAPVNSDLLVEELQLGEQLNQCVHSNRRSDFALMLSMLVEDVRVHSQFKLPKTSEEKVQPTDALLRKTFDLPKAASLALESLEDVTLYGQASLIEQNQLEALHLTQAIRPRPLSFRDNKAHIEHQVMSNTSLYCQRQHQQGELAQNGERLAFNVNQWLKAVQTTIVKAPLVDAAV